MEVPMPFLKNTTRSDNLIYNNYPIRAFVDCNIVQSGWEACAPNYSVGPATRSHFLFHYILKGKGTVSVLSSKGQPIDFEVKQNQGFMIFPNQHAFYVADSDLPWEYLWVEFDGLKANEYLNLAGFDFDNLLYTPNNVKLAHRDLLDELWYLVNHGEESTFNVVGHLFLLLDALQKSSGNRKELQQGDMNDFYIEEAIAFIEKNYAFSISVEDIATFVNINRSYFGKIFKEKTKTTPQDFLIRYRMAKACELLHDKSLLLNEVGTQVGYPNSLRFSRAFKNTYGCSPREWRYTNIN